MNPCGKKRRNPVTLSPADVRRYRWRLYGKHTSMKSYAPIDWKNGKPVGNLIYATMFTNEEMLNVKSQLVRTALENSAWKFEFRSIA